MESRPIRLCLLVGLWLIAVAGRAAADDPLTVTGRVADPAGKPLAGALVYATDSTGGELTATTGTDGRFELVVPAPGKYSIVVVLGEASAVSVVTIRPGTTSSVSFKLDAVPAPAARPSPVPAPPSVPARVTGRVEDVLGNPLRGARVAIVASSGASELVTHTDREGRFDATVRHPGKYTIIVGFRRVSSVRQVALTASEPVAVDIELDTTADGGEVIELEGAIAPPIKPEPKFNVARAPRYSDQAVLRDAWTRAWLLLDVDERGIVQRIKFLKRPGLELEKIAQEEAFAMTFTPARDATGKPVRALVVWDIEWPSHGWLLANTGLATHIPVLSAVVPCYGSGPLDFNDPYPTYRDCSVPDLSRAAHVRWVERK